ncbi:hypothetical protein GGI21_003914, partial [Coemansia aciculifera]
MSTNSSDVTVDPSSSSAQTSGWEASQQDPSSSNSATPNDQADPQCPGISTPELMQADGLLGCNNDYDINEATIDDDIDKLYREVSRGNCNAVWSFAFPRTLDLCLAASELTAAVALDLEARLLTAAIDKWHYRYMPWKQELSGDQLSMWANSILAWTGCSASAISASSGAIIDKRPLQYGAESAVLYLESLLLFVAHHVKAYPGQHASMPLRPEDCQLILPITKEVVEEPKRYLGVRDPKDLVRVTCGIFPLSFKIERQAPPAHHLVVANAEIAASQAEFDAAVRCLARDTKELYFSQHNRRFAWGLTVCCHIVRAYVYGSDTIWISSDMDVTSTAGRQALISLLVDWSLCSVDCLGFDPGVRYAFDAVSGLHLEIDVHEKNASTGEVARRTYFSNKCVVAADGLTGCHTRHFAASASIEAMDEPAFLIKDVWLPLNSNGSGERLVSNTLHYTLGRDSKLMDKLPQLVSTGPVYLWHGDM